MSKAVTSAPVAETAVTVRGIEWSLQFSSARKIWPLLDLLAKFRRVPACSCSQTFCNCSRARILVKICSIAQNFVNPSTSQNIAISPTTS